MAYKTVEKGNKVMKNVAMIIVSVVIGIVALASVMTITGRTDRQMELSSNLPSAVEETLNALFTKKQYQIADEEEFIADFRENLAKVIDSDCDITVDVAGLDVQKGCLSVRVTAEYKHPNGEPGSVTCERTVVFDRNMEEEAEVCTVKFYLEPGAMCYKSCKIYPGKCVAIPVAPHSDRGSFGGWVDEDGNMADFSQAVTADKTYYAIWN